MNLCLIAWAKEKRKSKALRVAGVSLNYYYLIRFSKVFGEGKMGGCELLLPGSEKGEGIDGKNSVCIHFNERRKKKSSAF